MTEMARHHGSLRYSLVTVDSGHTIVGVDCHPTPHTSIIIAYRDLHMVTGISGTQNVAWGEGGALGNGPINRRIWLPGTP